MVTHLLRGDGSTELLCNAMRVLPHVAGAEHVYRALPVAPRHVVLLCLRVVSISLNFLTRQVI